jgi:3-hydroxyisobutyrate dehydrogenase-like beta-hydroxyacid dehydrogenase
MTTTDVTVLGMGAMGRALAATLVASGRSVTVWNRTPGRSAPGAVVASTVAEAVAASPVVVVCVVDNAAMRSFLDPSQLDGRTLVNLTNGTPSQAREAAKLYPSYVDGGIMAVPPMIGGPGSLILYSGSSAAFAAVEPILQVWGEARYLGEDPGRAALYDLALLSAMYGMFGGVYHALALTASEGVPTAEILPMIKDWLTAMMAALPDGTNQPDSNLEMQATAYVNLLAASRDQGVRTDMVTAMGELLHRGVAAGPGVSLVDLLRTPTK